MKSADYGIDEPVVLINLIIVAIVTAGLAAIAYYQILPFRSDFLASLITKLCVFIVTFNFACLLLSVWSSKIGKISEAKRLLETYAWKGMKRFSMWDVDGA